jgi:hypothetical protein
MIGKRILAGVVLVLSAAMLIASLAGGIGVWIVKGPAMEKSETILGRIDVALNIAEQSLIHAQTSLSRAAERLEGAREEQRQLAQQPQQNSALRRIVARTVQQTVAPELGSANESLHDVAEAAVVVNAVLEDISAFPFLAVAGLDVGPLEELSTRLVDVGPAAWELSRLLGEPEQDAEATNNQFSRMQRAVPAIQALIAQYEPQLAAVRQRKEDVKARVTSWVMPAAVLISIACLWIALSQVGMMGHAWRWWKNAGATG